MSRPLARLAGFEPRPRSSRFHGPTCSIFARAASFFLCFPYESICASSRRNDRSVEYAARTDRSRRNTGMRPSDLTSASVSVAVGATSNLKYGTSVARVGNRSSAALRCLRAASKHTFSASANANPAIAAAKCDTSTLGLRTPLSRNSISRASWSWFGFSKLRTSSNRRQSASSRRPPWFVAATTRLSRGWESNN